MSCRLYLVLPLFCFVLFRFRLYAFVEAAALGSSTCMRPDSHTQIPKQLSESFSSIFSREMSLFPSIFCTALSFSLCMESTSYVLSFRMVFFYLETTGWIFDVSLCENSIQSKK